MDHKKWLYAILTSIIVLVRIRQQYCLYLRLRDISVNLLKLESVTNEYRYMFSLRSLTGSLTDMIYEALLDVWFLSTLYLNWGSWLQNLILYLTVLSQNRYLLEFHAQEHQFPLCLTVWLSRYGGWTNWRIWQLKKDNLSAIERFTSSWFNTVFSSTS